MPSPCNLYATGYPGCEEQLDGREGSSNVFHLEHVLEEGQDRPVITATCDIDASTPGLTEAYDVGKVLSEVCVDFYRIDPESQAEVKYYRIALHKARVMRVHTYVPVTFLPKNEYYRHMVEYRFSYERIEYQWYPSGIVYVHSTEESPSKDGA